ncbi:protein of unknown function [Shewanella benthica]|uniref:Uncharacterized protein n=1 Tax=Shewanella benthica TaxID=43661 RepID=A0A330LZQ3_9GAMM|nr:protein of unknown function [Shewanella benthica]
MTSHLSDKESKQKSSLIEHTQEAAFILSQTS